MTRGIRPDPPHRPPHTDLYTPRARRVATSRRSRPCSSTQPALLLQAKLHLCRLRRPKLRQTKTALPSGESESLCCRIATCHTHCSFGIEVCSTPCVSSWRRSARIATGNSTGSSSASSSSIEIRDNVILLPSKSFTPVSYTHLTLPTKA